MAPAGRLAAKVGRVEAEAGEPLVVDGGIVKVCSCVVVKVWPPDTIVSTWLETETEGDCDCEGGEVTLWEPD
jgi:hypothetical protein